MSQYCTKCGETLRANTVYCTHCGTRIAPGSMPDREFGAFLAKACLCLARGFLTLLLGGTVFACGGSGICLLVVGGVLLYHFATAGVLVLPAALAAAAGVESIGGAGLAIGGVASCFIAILFALAAISVCKLLKK